MNAAIPAASHSGLTCHSKSGTRDKVAATVAATVPTTTSPSAVHEIRRTVGFDHRSAGGAGSGETRAGLRGGASSSTGMAREGSGWAGAAPASRAETDAASLLEP